MEPAWRSPAYVRGEQQIIDRDDYRGVWHVLYWYPLDFTFVCPTEIRGFQALRSGCLCAADWQKGEAFAS